MSYNLKPCGKPLPVNSCGTRKLHMCHSTSQHKPKRSAKRIKGGVSVGLRTYIYISTRLRWNAHLRHCPHSSNHRVSPLVLSHSDPSSSIHHHASFQNDHCCWSSSRQTLDTSHRVSGRCTLQEHSLGQSGKHVQYAQQFSSEKPK